MGKNYFDIIPPELIAMILANLDAKEILTCRLLSKQFEEIISDYGFWLCRLQQSKELQPENEKVLLDQLKNHSWKYLAYVVINNPFYRNLIVNGSAEFVEEHKDDEYRCEIEELQKQFAPWVIVENCGDGWEVERPPIGADTTPENPDIVRDGCFVSSYGLSVMQQKVDVSKILEKFANVLAPVIQISDWCAGRWDCPSVYRLEVSLLSDPRKPASHPKKKRTKVLDICHAKVNLGANSTGKEWRQITHSFPYNAGVHHVVFERACSDRSTWSGWYGAKATGACVKLALSSS